MAGCSGSFRQTKTFYEQVYHETDIPNRSLTTLLRDFRISELASVPSRKGRADRRVEQHALPQLLRQERPELSFSLPFLPFLLFSSCFPPSVFYRVLFPVSASRSSVVVSSARADDFLLSSTSHRFYCASNMDLFIVGDVDPCHVLECIKRTFGTETAVLTSLFLCAPSSRTFLAQRSPPSVPRTDDGAADLGDRRRNQLGYAAPRRRAALCLDQPRRVRKPPFVSCVPLLCLQAPSMLPCCRVVCAVGGAVRQLGTERARICSCTGMSSIDADTLR
eukprot:3223485-Rhodomonas_salina.5